MMRFPIAAAQVAQLRKVGAANMFRESASGAKTDRKAGFRSLGDAWADTTTAHGRRMLTVLGGPAEFERGLIRARTGEGRARAAAVGVNLGRKPKLTPHQKKEALRRVEAGERLRDIARSYNVHHATISRLG